MQHNKKLYGKILLGLMGSLLTYGVYKAFTYEDDEAIAPVTAAEKAIITPALQKLAAQPVADLPVITIAPASTSGRGTASNPMLNLVSKPNPTGKSPIELSDEQLNTYFDKTINDLKSRTDSALIKQGLEYLRTTPIVRNMVISEAKKLNKSMEDVVMGYISKFISIK